MALEPQRAPPDTVNRRLFAVLLGLAFVAAVLILPFAAEFRRPQEPDRSFALLLAEVLCKRVGLSAIAIALGVYLGPPIGLDAPLLRGWIAGDAGLRKRFLAILPPTLVVGAAGGLTLLLAVPRLGEWLTPELGRDPNTGATPIAPFAVGKVALAAISAGIAEELQFRFGLLTLFAWVLTRLAGMTRPGAIILWTANVLAAVAFALAHIPNAVLLGMTVTPGLLVIILASNGFAGLFFGWLFWRFGLESAMLAHVVLDIVFKVLGPFIIPHGR
jgi:Type II CAAX prenyl endopeptidase Rce1-like